MNNKRSRKKIYYFIDCFFLALPLILFVGGFIWYISVSKGAITSFVDLEDFASSEMFSWVSLTDFLPSFLGKYFDNFLVWFAQSFMPDDNFVSSLISSLGDIFAFIGLDPDVWSAEFRSVSTFVFFYLQYIICYEFLSLLVNVILWIPRFFKNRLENTGGVE